MMEIQATMKFFEHRFYRLPSLLSRLFGMWPYQSTSSRLSIYTILTAFGLPYVIPFSMNIMEKRNDFDYLMEAFHVVLMMWVAGCEFASALLLLPKMLLILNRIQKDWEVWSQEREIIILHDYAERGMKIATVYTVMMFATSTAYVILATFPTMIDVLLRNGSKHKEFPIPIDYHYIDAQKYYFFLLLHIYVCMVLTFFGTAGVECWLVTMVHHSCGLFAAVKLKIERIGANVECLDTGKSFYAKNDWDVNGSYLGLCIQRHNDAMEFVELMDSYFTWGMMMYMGINVLMISLTAFQIAMGTQSHRDMFNGIVINVILIIHLYANNYGGQMIMDYSMSIVDPIINGEWYQLPLKTQKMLLLLLMRCSIPCKLTAGKICIMSIESFRVFCNSAVSYFMLLRTMWEIHQE